MLKMERHRRAEPSEPLGALSGTHKDAEGPAFSPMRATDKISLLRELPWVWGHMLLCKFPVIKPPIVFK